jgi:3-oxoacyl-[acyl-carrier protein] reductase
MRNVIVTGGSHGIGLGIVHCLAKAGYRVMAVAREESPLLREAIDEAARSGTGPIGLAAVAYLLSDGARNVIGTVVTVDAGSTA